jgi:hypothetical protein
MTNARMTTRQLMIRVAVFGTLIGLTARMVVNSPRYEWLAKMHENRAVGVRDCLSLVASEPIRRRMRAKIRWHETMAWRYRHPILLLLPDPPEPE